MSVLQDSPLQCNNLQHNNPLIENYLAQFDLLSLEEQHIVVAVLNQKQSNAVPHLKIAQKTPEERQAAIKKFMETFGGCMEGMPHMTLKEIRAERLEKKYGTKND